MPVLLLVATAGGHLAELLVLSSRWAEHAEIVWVTNDTEQARTALQGQRVEWARYSTPRDVGAAVHHFRQARRLLRHLRVDHVVSTGASLAPPFFAAARLARVRCSYIESATRLAAPSMSGRIAARIPGVSLSTQSPTWNLSRWRYAGSVWDEWSARPSSDPAVLRRVLVTVGTARDYPFPRMIEACRRVLPADVEVTWQIGRTSASGLRGDVHEFMPAEELRRRTAEADLVISHAGTGSALAALTAGRCPVLIPRSGSAGEHVDDHQVQLADLLSRRGLAVVAGPAELTSDHLSRAVSTDVVRSHAAGSDLGIVFS